MIRRAIWPTLFAMLRNRQSCHLILDSPALYFRNSLRVDLFSANERNIGASFMFSLPKKILVQLEDYIEPYN